MKKPIALIVISAAAAIALVCSCQGAASKASPSGQATSAAAQTSASAAASPAASVSASASPSASAPASASVSAPASPFASASPKPSLNVSLAPVSPAVSLVPVSPFPSVTVSPKPSLSVITPAVTMPNVSLNPVLAGHFQFSEQTYKNGPISIKYPQITGYSDKSVQDKLNKLIADSAMRDVAEVKGDSEIADYEIKSTVSLNSQAAISVYFNGYMNRKMAAHPNQFFYTVTLDVKKLQPVTLTQLVTVTPDFFKKLQNSDIMANGIDLTPDFVKAVRDNLKTFDTDFWIKQLKKADTAGAEVSSFLTKNALGVSVGVPHVMGDHVEFLIKFSDLAGFQTDNLLWKELQK